MFSAKIFAYFFIFLQISTVKFRRSVVLLLLLLMLDDTILELPRFSLMRTNDLVSNFKRRKLKLTNQKQRK